MIGCKEIVGITARRVLESAVECVRERGAFHVGEPLHVAALARLGQPIDYTNPPEGFDIDPAATVALNVMRDEVNAGRQWRHACRAAFEAVNARTNPQVDCILGRD